MYCIIKLLFKNCCYYCGDAELDKYVEGSMNMKANEDIREYIKSSGVKSYEVARALGLDAPTFSRKLQIELSPNDKYEIKKIVDQLAARQKNNQKSVFSFNTRSVEDTIATIGNLDILKLAAKIRRLAFKGESREDYERLSKLAARMANLLEE